MARSPSSGSSCSGTPNGSVVWLAQIVAGCRPSGMTSRGRARRSGHGLPGHRRLRVSDEGAPCPVDRPGAHEENRVGGAESP